jgi:hypothetical protein
MPIQLITAGYILTQASHSLTQHSMKMTVFDEIAETDGDHEWKGLVGKGLRLKG